MKIMTEAFEQWWNEKYAGNWKPQVLEDFFKELVKEGWMAALESIKEDDELEDSTTLSREEQLESTISLVFDLPDNTIKAFIKESTVDELHEAESWCVQAYYGANDNTVKVPPMPEFLQQLKDLEGQDV